MATQRQVMVRFTDARAGRSRATCGQRAMYGFLANLEPRSYLLNVVQVVPVPDGLGLEEVLGSVRDLVLRHESLRTTFSRAADGTLWQDLTADGTIHVEVCESDGDDPEQLGARLERDLQRTTFDLASSWPIRVLVGTVYGDPLVIMMVMSHIAVDLASARIVRQDLLGLMTARVKHEDPATLPDRRQPLDQAAYEESEPGRRQLARAMADWRARLVTTPRTMFPTRPGPAERQQHWRGQLNSTAFALAANVLAVRYQVGTAVVAMAAQAVLLGQQAGADVCALDINVANRVTTDMAWSVGNVTQSSLAVIDLREADFAAVVRRTWRAWMRAHRTGPYDYADLRALRRDLEYSRGIAFDLECYFNDLRPPGLPHPVSSSATTAEILAATPTSEFAWTERIEKEHMKFFLRLSGDERRAEISALVDTAFITPDATRTLLFGMERLLVAHATGQPGVLTPDTIEELTGTAAPRRDAGWIRRDGGWVEIAAVGELLQFVVGGDAATAVFAESTGDGHRLVGYLAPFDGAGCPTPADLHRRCVAALANPLSAEPRWLSAVAPDHYVVFDGGPAAPHDPAGLAARDDRSAWSALTVVTEGSGRSLGAHR
ncbi:MAG: hypothetical protein V7603_3985 [Micromonosporaceae bacterium]